MAPGNERKQRSKSAQGSYGGYRSKSYSAPVPLELSVIREETDGLRERDTEDEQTCELLS